MDVAAIDAAKLKDLCNTIRQLKRLSSKEKRDAITSILKAADAIRIMDVEYLICLRCATELRGYTATSTLFRMGESGRLTVYHLCHKDYYDRREIEAMPPVGELHGKHNSRRSG